MPEPQWRQPGPGSPRGRRSSPRAHGHHQQPRGLPRWQRHLGSILWVEMEHSPITLETLRNIVLTTRGLPACVFARVPVVELWTAKRVLDQGVSGVIFPFTSTPELAARAAQACSTRR